MSKDERYRSRESTIATEEELAAMRLKLAMIPRRYFDKKKLSSIVQESPQDPKVIYDVDGLRERPMSDETYERAKFIYKLMSDKAHKAIKLNSEPFKSTARLQGAAEYAYIFNTESIGPQPQDFNFAYINWFHFALIYLNKLGMKFIFLL